MTHWHGTWVKGGCRPNIPIITPYRHLPNTKPSGGSVICYARSYAGGRGFRSHRWHVRVPNLEDARVGAPFGGGAPAILFHTFKRLTIPPATLPSLQLSCHRHSESKPLPFIVFVIETHASSPSSLIQSILWSLQILASLNSLDCWILRSPTRCVALVWLAINIAQLYGSRIYETITIASIV